MFVQNGSTGLFVDVTTEVKLVPGDRVLIKGVTHEGYRPYVVSSDLTLLGHGALPKPIPANYEDLIGPRDDSVLVTARGVVRAANMNAPSAAHANGATFKMLTDGGTVDVVLDNSSASALGNLLDAKVAVTGVASGRFDGKGQKSGILLHVASLDDVDVVKRAAVDPWSLPITPMDEIQGGYRVNDLTSRVRVSGVVTYYEPGSTVVLQNGTRSLWITTHSFSPLRIGDQADATGFPAANEGFLQLTASEIRDSGVAVPVAPLSATWQQLASSQHIFDLVSIEGQVAVTAREAAQDEYVLVSDGYEFSAIYRRPAGSGPSSLAPMKAIPVGSRIRVTGICVPLNSNSFGHDAQFNILLRSPDDIEVITTPGLLNAHNIALCFAGLLLLVLAGGHARVEPRVQEPAQGGFSGVHGATPRAHSGRHQSFPAAGRDFGAHHRAGLGAAEWRCLLVPRCRRRHAGQPAGAALCCVVAHRRTSHPFSLRAATRLVVRRFRRAHQA